MASCSEGNMPASQEVAKRRAQGAAASRSATAARAGAERRAVPCCAVQRRAVLCLAVPFPPLPAVPSPHAARAQRLTRAPAPPPACLPACLPPSRPEPRTAALSPVPAPPPRPHRRGFRSCTVSIAPRDGRSLPASLTPPSPPRAASARRRKLPPRTAPRGPGWRAPAICGAPATRSSAAGSTGRPRSCTAARWRCWRTQVLRGRAGRGRARLTAPHLTAVCRAGEAAAEERSVLLANRAACQLRDGACRGCVADCCR